MAQKTHHFRGNSWFSGEEDSPTLDLVVGEGGKERRLWKWGNQVIKVYINGILGDWFKRKSLGRGK